jgi:hypothetical protein
LPIPSKKVKLAIVDYFVPPKSSLPKIWAVWVYNPLKENSLNPQKRAELEKAALMASAIGRGQISLRLRQSIIDDYVLDMLDGRR